MQLQLSYGTLRHQQRKLALSVYEYRIKSEGPGPCICCILIGQLVVQGTAPFTYIVMLITSLPKEHQDLER